MRKPTLTSLIVLALNLLLPFAQSEDSWPGWRGPRGDGSSLDRKAPLEWSIENNLVWKTRIPGRGHASPIIWENSIFVLTAIEETSERKLLRINRRTGKPIWARTVLEAPLEVIHHRNTYASSTPATDGKRVFVSFLDQGQMYVAAYNYRGRKLWEARPGPYNSDHGFCSSPVLWKDKVIFNGDHRKYSYLVALDQKTGEVVWKIERENGTRSYCTPIIRTIEGRNQLIFSGSRCIASYDPDTGERHWIFDGPTKQYVASPVYDGEYVMVTCGHPDKLSIAIDPRGSGNITETHEKWRIYREAAFVPSPITLEDLLFVISDRGKLSCMDTDSGKLHWSEVIGREHGASAISLQGHACFISGKGDMTVIKPGKSIDIVATNKLGESVQASPAIANGQWFIRGSEHLYCIGKAN